AAQRDGSAAQGGLTMIPASYNVRNLIVRKGTTAPAVFGIFLVTVLFAAVFMLNNGIHRTIVSSGRSDVAVILRPGSDAELSSGLALDSVGLLGAKDMVATTPQGGKQAVGEVVVVITAEKAGTDGGVSNVLVRGVPDNVWDFRAEFGLLAGRKPKPG